MTGDLDYDRQSFACCYSENQEAKPHGIGLDFYLDLISYKPAEVADKAGAQGGNFTEGTTWEALYKSSSYVQDVGKMTNSTAVSLLPTAL